MVTKKAVKKSVSSSKASQKKSKKKADPPIVVGGGNSTFVFIPAGTTITTLTQKPSYIGNLSKYDCYEVSNFDVTNVDVFNGTGGQKSDQPKDKKKHHTDFS